MRRRSQEGNLLRGVAPDSAYVASFLEQRTTGPVVLVYVNAFIPDVGESVFDILGDSGSALVVPDPTTVLDLAGYRGAPEGDIEAFLEPSVVHESFAHFSSGGGALLIAASQRPIALGANIGPTEAAAWNTLPGWP